MNIQLLKKLKSILQKRTIPTPTISEEDTKHEESKINISNEYGFTIVDIKEDCKTQDFLDISDQHPIEDLNKNVGNATLFDGSLSNIKKKKIYIKRLDDALYNIYSNDTSIHIDEKLKQLNDNEEVFIDERIIDINKQTGHYKITRMKHSKNRSTFYVKFFSSEKPDYEFFHLYQTDALTIAKETIENTASLENIDKIINLKEVLSYLPIEDNIKPIQYKKKSNLPPSDATLYM